MLVIVCALTQIKKKKSTITTLQVSTRLHVSFEHDGHRILKVLRTYLHLRPLHRVVGFFPLVPGHSFNIILAMEVQTIQVRFVTSVIPPGAFICQGTVATARVIIAIFGGKRLQWPR